MTFTQCHTLFTLFKHYFNTKNNKGRAKSLDLCCFKGGALVGGALVSSAPTEQNVHQLIGILLGWCT